MSLNPRTIGIGKVGSNSVQMMNLYDDTSSGDAVTTEYVDARAPYETFTTLSVLTPSDVQALHTDPGFLIKEYVPDKIIVPLHARLFCDEGDYTCNGAYLFFDFGGNYQWGQSHDWQIPTESSPIGLLNSSYSARAISFNNSSLMLHPMSGSDLYLNSTAAITGGTKNLTVEVAYQLWPLFPAQI